LVPGRRKAEGSNKVSFNGCFDSKESLRLSTKPLQEAGIDPTKPLEVEIKECIPHKLLAWRSIPGSRVESEGSVRFDEHPNVGRRKPPAGVLGHLVASLFGADPKHEMDDDMVQLKSLIELGRTRSHGKRITRQELELGVG